MTKEQIAYIQEQQKKASTLVRDPSSPYFLPKLPNEDEEAYAARLLTASRTLMRTWEHEKARLSSSIK